VTVEVPQRILLDTIFLVQIIITASRLAVSRLGSCRFSSEGQRAETCFIGGLLVQKVIP
jgi:hypothetical protein